MNLNLLKADITDYLSQNESKNVHDFALMKSPFEAVSSKDLAQQLFGRQIAKYKFPKLYKSVKILYPPKVNIEQSSSEITSDYKAQFIKKNENIIDLTGGFGIDCIAFSQKSSSITYCELNENTFEYAKHNFEVLGLPISSNFCDGIAFLQQIEEHFDLIYIDPSRRNKQSKKVFRLEDCSPNIIEHAQLIKSKSKRAIIKLSPLVDIDYCLSNVENIAEIHIISVKNEVKELVLILNFVEATDEVKITTVNLNTSHEAVQFSVEDLQLQQEFSEVKRYLYEPHPGLMKSGAFGFICKIFNLKALSINSHLFTSDEIIKFPGRCFEVLKTLSPNKKEIKKAIPDLKANISCRNYPLKPEQVKKKYGMIDGSNLYVFFTTDMGNKKVVLICKKIQI